MEFKWNHISKRGPWCNMVRYVHVFHANVERRPEVSWQNAELVKCSPQQIYKKNKYLLHYFETLLQVENPLNIESCILYV